MAETLRVSLGSATAVPLLHDVASTTERAMPGHPDDLGRVQNWGEQYDALILEHTCQCTSQGSRKNRAFGSRKSEVPKNSAHALPFEDELRLERFQHPALLFETEIVDRSRMRTQNWVT